MKRRECLGKLAAVGAMEALVGALPLTAKAHANSGPVSPALSAPDLSFTDHLGRQQSLRRWLTGHVTAVQTVFAGCSSVCPIQGALFAASQRRLSGQSLRTPVRWLSMSIDPLGDSPDSLRAWLQRMGPTHAAWTAGLPRVADVDLLLRSLDGSNATPAQTVDGHSDKVYVFDAQAQLRWRTASLPTVEEVARVLVHFSA
jgi:protein SCO1